MVVRQYDFLLIAKLTGGQRMRRKRGERRPVEDAARAPQGIVKAAFTEFEVFHKNALFAAFYAKKR